MLKAIKCRLKFEKRQVGSLDIEGALKEPPATNRGSQEPPASKAKSEM